ncbi:hypothetical protein HGM15179_020236 [Zosterops borbonicus]|uniref:Peptidase A2 domain-containing protein n=1 Tax=Zosterops borbonicus TaxID=364589 RepID=A0A8K1DAJ2_9PASS|nr:hypothetical protein HGM15179_020236 [Zosterops borbonicus]
MVENAGNQRGQTNRHPVDEDIARKSVVRSLAFTHANDVCKRAMLTLPKKPKPTLQDYIQVVTEVVPMMTLGRPGKKDPHHQTVAAATETIEALPATQTPRTSGPMMRPSRGSVDKPSGARDPAPDLVLEDKFLEKMQDPPLQDPPPDVTDKQFLPPPDTSLTTTSQHVPFGLALVSPLWIRDSEWHTAKVARNRGTWHLIGTESVVMGDCKYTPPEIEIAPGKMSSDPEWFVLWLRCTRPPVFLAKGQIVAQLIPDPQPWRTRKHNSGPQVNPVIVIDENRPEEECQLKVSGETKTITGLLDTGADITIVPEHMWPSHWPLQTVVEQVEGVGGLQLAKRSKSMVQIEGSRGQLANIRPFVLNYSAPLWGRNIMAQWGVTIGFPDPPQNFWAAATERRPTQKLNWKTDEPVWVEQWPLSKQKLMALEELVEEQLRKGHIKETTSPWNSSVFVIQKADKTKWHLLQDL